MLRVCATFLYLQSFKSQSIFDKPDLLKASEPSLSLHSFNNEFGEYTDVARYNVSRL